MNTERILHLANVIETLEPLHPEEVIELEANTPDFQAIDAFSMAQFYYECGTPACIAGWADFLWSADHTDDFHTGERARDILGLEEDLSHELFEPAFVYGEVDIGAFDYEKEFISPERAAAVLRNLANTGVVDWSIRA